MSTPADMNGRMRRSGESAPRPAWAPRLARAPMQVVASRMTLAMTLAFAMLPVAGCGLPDPGGAAALGSPAPALPDPEETIPPAPRLEPVAEASGPKLDARILVLSADGQEPELGAIRQTLDAMGTPYEAWIATKRPGALTAAALADDAARHGHYQAIFLTNGQVAHMDGGTWRSALSDAEWAALRAYEAAYRVRAVSWHTSPDVAFGYDEAGGGEAEGSTLRASLTPEGAKVFPELRPQAGIPLTGSFAYLAKALAGATPLLTDGAGHALALTHVAPDGRETLSLTFSNSALLLSTNLLAHGLVAWATRGIFLGERRAYASAQVDDLFIPNAIYGSSTPLRISGADLDALVAWQQGLQARPTAAGVRLDLAFNGLGAPLATKAADGLVSRALANASRFKWISHTFSHLDFDPLPHDTVLSEVQRNIAAGTSLGLPGFHADALVTPEVSGLANPEAMRAVVEAGVRYVVSDTSHPDQDPPVPNTGIYNAHEPTLLEIPRHPTNLYYDVSTPAEWTREYNDRYRATMGRDLSYPEVLAKESDQLLLYLARGEFDPWMFHQANLHAYDGTHSLLGDLLDATFDKYDALCTLPVLSPSMDALGRAIAARMAYRAAGASATISGAASGARTITLTAARDASIPVTGLVAPGGETYGPEALLQVPLAAGQSLTLALP